MRRRWPPLPARPCWSCAPVRPRFTDLGAAGDRLAHQLLVKELGACIPTTMCDPRRVWSMCRGRAGSGSSIRSTGPGSSGNGTGPTGPSTWLWSSEGGRGRRCRPAGHRHHALDRRTRTLPARADGSAVGRRQPQPATRGGVRRGRGHRRRYDPDGVGRGQDRAVARCGRRLRARRAASTSGNPRGLAGGRRRGQRPGRIPSLNGDPFRYGAADAWLPDLWSVPPGVGRGAVWPSPWRIVGRITSHYVADRAWRPFASGRGPRRTVGRAVLRNQHGPHSRRVGAHVICGIL